MVAASEPLRHGRPVRSQGEQRLVILLEECRMIAIGRVYTRQL